MPSSRGRLGLKAEIAAAAELGKQGYRIITSNYRCRLGEIDLIAMDGDTLAFVEVRCKRTSDFGTPAESVTPSKQKKIAAAAQDYLIKNSISEVACRFDIVEVVSENGKLVIKDIIKDAFWV